MTPSDHSFLPTLGRRAFLGAACFGAAQAAGLASAQQGRGLTEPVFRVAKKVEPQRKPPAHPLDPALEMARNGLVHSQKTIRDYTCILIKRERVNGKVGAYEVMKVKIRNRKVAKGRVVTPFAVYLNFQRPKSILGREVLYIEGKNNGKMIAHEGGNLKLLPAVWLSPTGALAMRGQLYPLTEIGLENLMAKLIERGQRERKWKEINVQFFKGYKIKDRVCTKIEIHHPVKKAVFDFQRAEIFVDDQLNVPVRYAAYDWPKKQGVAGEVLEEYTYVDVKLNVGLTARDFDYKNPAYNFV